MSVRLPLRSALWPWALTFLNSPSPGTREWGTSTSVLAPLCGPEGHARRRPQERRACQNRHRLSRVGIVIVPMPRLSGRSDRETHVKYALVFHLAPGRRYRIVIVVESDLNFMKMYGRFIEHDHKLIFYKLSLKFLQVVRSE